MNILTSFPFTFKLAVPGLSNPFSSLSTSPTTGTNPPRPAPPEPRPGQLDFSERPSRSLARPTRPLPIPLGSNQMLGSTLGRRPRPSFSPSPSPTPSTSISLAHSYSHLAPRSHLGVPQQHQWHEQSRFLQTPPQSHSTSPAPLSRKRGWEPSYPSPSESQATLECGSGYLDAPPARYRDIVADKMEVMEVDQMDAVRGLDENDLPPTKRRRGIAGSIVETAWSAALLGTAVGLTVYRLWQNRGKQQDDTTDYTNNDNTDDDDADSKRRRKRGRADVLSHEILPEPSSPPPPYNQEWTSVDYPRSGPVTPSRARDKGKSRIAPRSATRKTVVRALPRRDQHRSKGYAGATTAPPASGSSIRSGSSRSPAVLNPEFDFRFDSSQHRNSTSTAHNNFGPVHIEVEEAEDEDDQMDWIGGKLAQLIEEGKKALGKEVVVMSDAKEDEVDDGSGAWVSDEEQDRLRPGSSLKRRGSTASSRYNPHSHANTLGRRSVGPPSQHQQTLASTPPRRTHARGLSYDTAVGSPGGYGGRLEDPGECESPEVREMMERARAKLAGRALGR